jgi:WD40 repeat protein/beta-lactamase regulating signal transducer with metallopeptidase domain
MIDIEWLNGSLSLRLAITLLLFLWQGLAIAILASVASRWFAPLGAQVRYTIHVCALIMMSACLPVTFFMIDVSWAEQVRSRDRIAMDARQTPIGPGSPPDMLLGPRPPDHGRIDQTALTELDRPPNRSPVEESGDTGRAENRREYESTENLSAGAPVENSLPPNSRSDGSADGAFIIGGAGFHSIGPTLAVVAPFISTIYLLGVTGLLARLVVGLWGGERLRRSAISVNDASLVTMIRYQAERMGLALAPTIAYCDRVAMPVVVGVLRPMILLPAALVSGLTPDQLQAVVLHELAHIRRRDSIINLLQRVIESLLFFHPAVWLISRRISRERELAADDLVLRAGWSGPLYADALVRMAELSSAFRAVDRGALLLAASGTRSSEFRCRVLRLLESADSPQVRLSRGGLAALVFIAASLLIAPAMLAWTVLPRASERLQQQETSDQPQTPPDLTQVGDQLLGPEPAEADTEGQDRQQDDSEVGDQLDQYGDPIPKGAVSRLGSIRFRPALTSVRGVSLQFVPDQQLLVARGREGGVGLWDPVTGKLLRELALDGHGIQDFQLTPDGTHVVILALAAPRPDDREYRVRLVHWNVQTGEITAELKWSEPFAEFSQKMALTPDGKSVAIGTESGHLRILELATGEELLKRKLVESKVYSIAFSDNGRWLAMAGHQQVVLWKWLEDEEAHQPLIDPLEGQGALSLAFSPDSKWLATGRVDRGGIRVWNVATRKLQWQTDVSDIDYTAERIEFSADGRLLVVPAADRGDRLELRDAATGRLVRSFSTGGVPLSFAAISPDQLWAAGYDYSSILHVWNLRDGTPQHDQFVGPRHMVDLMEFSPDAKRLFSASRRSVIGIWDTKSGIQLGELNHQLHRLANLVISPSGKYAAAMSYDNTMHLWSTETGREQLSLPGHGRFGNASAHAIAFLADDQRFVSFGSDMYLRTWDIRTGRMIGVHDLLHDENSHLRTKDGTLADSGRSSPLTADPFVSQAAFSPDGRRLLTYHSQTLTTFDVETGMEVHRVDIPKVDCLRISPDGSVVVMKERHESDEEDRRLTSVVTIRDSDSLRVIHKIPLPASFRFANQIQFTSQGNHFVISSNPHSFDGKDRHLLHLYDTRSGELKGTGAMTQRPRSFSFAPDGTRLAVSYDDTTILVWDADQLFEEDDMAE